RLLRPRALDELDQRERRRVTAADAELDDPRVAAGAAIEARGQLVEQLLQDAAPADDARRSPPRVERALLPERDHAVRPATELLRLRVGCAHDLVLEERGHEVAEEGAAVGRRASEPHPCDAV